MSDDTAKLKIMEKLAAPAFGVGYDAPSHSQAVAGDLVVVTQAPPTPPPPTQAAFTTGFTTGFTS